MLTVWRFAEDGGKICVFDEFSNASVSGGKGTLSVAESPPLQQIVWKLTWLTADEQIQFELYVMDQLDKGGAPMMTRKHLLRLAEGSLSSGTRPIR
jgi:hypothetical protein